MVRDSLWVRALPFTYLRGAGVCWAEIGAALGITEQQARQRAGVPGAP